MANTNTATVGQAVKVNGYDGTITEVCTGQIAGMVVVRLASGSVCVSLSEVHAASRARVDVPTGRVFVISGFRIPEVR